MTQPHVRHNGFVQPALFTGTSSEFLGRRALPRVVRDRPVVFVMGPDGSGKTRVAEKLARVGVSKRARPRRLDSRELQRAVIERIKRGSWPARLRRAKSLVLDGPVWLRNRPAVVDVLYELLNERIRNGGRTILVQSDADGSVELLMGKMETGSLVVVGLRFPQGPRGKLRFARRMCGELDLPRDAARGSQHIQPWRYARVITYLEKKKIDNED